MSGKPKQMERDAVGQAILDARLKARLTQEEVAEALGVYSTDIARWEKTGRIRDKKKFSELAKILKTTTDDLLGLNEPVEYYEIKNGVMRRFVDGIDKGIVHLPEEEVDQIAKTVNALIDSQIRIQRQKRKLAKAARR